MKRAALALVLAVCAAAVITLSASAQDKGGTQKPILHQDIIPPEQGQGRASALMDGKAVFGATPTEGKNPSAFANGEKILPQPEHSRERKGKEPIHGQGGFAADRDTVTRPDRQTGSDDTLQYVTVFNPSVLPFKRMSAMNAVDEQFQLRSRDTNARQELSVGGAPSSERDLFWGSLMIELSPDKDIAIPSVAPDMRILSYEVEPRIPLVFSKDSSDNYYVRTEESGASGVHRLVFMVDASATYFAPRIPKNYRVSDVTRLAHPSIQVPVPPGVKAYADKALDKLDISRSSRLDDALDKLTYYFRGFSAKELPSMGDNTYWDLFINKAGVCRHRSYVFMITANALGLPTRYVTNEAHALVEVWVPQTEWMRVDLGGAALRMQVDNASDKSLHQPRGEDPFESPKEYDENYTQLEGDIEGLTDEQIAERKQSNPFASGDAASPSSFDPTSPESDSEDTSRRVGPGRTLDEIPEEAIKNKIQGRIRVTRSANEAFRGEDLPVEGVIFEDRDGSGIGGQRIDLWLAPLGRQGEDAELVGSTVSKGDGTFSAIISLPDDLALREYEVYATSPGDARYAPALSN